MENPFKQWWLSIDWILHIIEFEKDFTNFLLDIQADYRIQRAMGEDEGNVLLNWTRVIDDIIWRIANLEEAREQYYAKLKEEENIKIQNELAKNW